MKRLHLIILASLIAFGSLGAVIITPTMPIIARHFNVSAISSQQLITLYLLGYACGQLIYGPLCKGYGSRLTLKLASLCAILGSGICLLAGFLGNYNLLLAGRVVTALGGAGGLKMCFTLVNYLCEPKHSSRVMGWLTLAFAGVPGVGIYCTGLLSSTFGWTSAFWLMLIYSSLILIVSARLPEVIAHKDTNALNLVKLLTGYLQQFKSCTVVAGGLLLGTASALSYLFNALAPNIAMLHYHLDSVSFANYNFIPLFGILSGALSANYLASKYSGLKLILIGSIIAFGGSLILVVAGIYQIMPVLALFVGGMVINFGMSFVFACSSGIALSRTNDKANGSAVMSFINMSYAFAVVLLSGLFSQILLNGLGLVAALLISLGLIWLVVVHLAVYSKPAN